MASYSPARRISPGRFPASVNGVQVLAKFAVSTLVRFQEFIIGRVSFGFNAEHSHRDDVQVASFVLTAGLALSSRLRKWAHK